MLFDARLHICVAGGRSRNIEYFFTMLMSIFLSEMTLAAARSTQD
jgi:hypothetical protein